MILVYSSTARGDTTYHSGYYDSMWLDDSGPIKGAYSRPASLLMSVIIDHHVYD